MDQETYTFKIGAYSPDTIPMARLAEYMAAIAELYGEQRSVHFQALKKGSTVLVSRVEHEAAPKVRENVQSAQWADSRGPAALAFKRVNKMLRDDNATGEVRRGRAKVLQFPGRDVLLPARLGPFNQAVSKDGVLVRIGGKDSTAHAMLEGRDHRIFSFEVSRDLAIQLAHHLFGDPIRLVGQGRAFRNEQGEWEFLSLKATGFVRLSNESLAGTVQRIRQATGGTAPAGASAAIRLLRDDTSEPR
jgi:hypothetical protein